MISSQFWFFNIKVWHINKKGGDDSAPFLKFYNKEDPYKGKNKKIGGFSA
jgi:hypothetical protein